MSFSNSQDDDFRDVRASQEGDPAAYGRLVERYEDTISRQMWRFTRDPVDHRELVQEVFVDAYLSLNSFRFKAPWLHWLRKVATRRGYQYWKRTTHEREARRALDRVDWPQWNAGTTLEQLSAKEAADKVHQLLTQLPPRDRLVLTLLYLEELSVDDISKRLDWSRSMVKVQAYRARKKLRRLLEVSDNATQI